jgi:hypothetical protein
MPGEDPQRDIQYYNQKLAVLCARERELAAKLEELKQIAEANDELLVVLRERAASTSESFEYDSAEDAGLDAAACHLEALAMQLEDHLSFEMQLTVAAPTPVRRPEPKNQIELKPNVVFAGCSLALSLAVLLAAVVSKKLRNRK